MKELDIDYILKYNNNYNGTVGYYTVGFENDFLAWISMYIRTCRHLLINK